MKKYLSALEKELKKLKMSYEEVDEILSDHKEMIETALNEGLTEEDLHQKFGKPEELARQLFEDSMNEGIPVNVGGTFDPNKLEGYALFKSFNVLGEAYDVSIGLISEDVRMYTHDQDTIEVYHKGDTANFDLSFEQNVFSFKAKKKVGFFNFKKSTKFVVVLPTTAACKEFHFSITSGDAELEGIVSKESKINTVSGDIVLRDYISGDTKFNTISGDFEIFGVQTDDLFCKAISGDYEVESGKVNGSLMLKTISGDFELKQVVAGATTFNSVSGDLDGSDFYPTEITVKTVSGDVEISNSDSTKAISLVSKKSASGDVKINGTKQ